MIINEKEFYSKVLGCWMGKNAGGTLGAPMEWKRQVNNVTFYTQDMKGEPLPNDDLDIQLLWLVALEERGIDINGRTLGEYWQTYVTPFWAEYGAAKINMRSGLMPPLSGMANNVFKHSCGAYIRSEIWACIAPGAPDIAVKYAYEDAIIDHGDGEGVYAEMFAAALESAAFVEKDIDKLIDIALSYIPAECDCAKAVKLACELYAKGTPLLEARDEIIRQFKGGFYFSISEEDVAKGLDGGRFGWEVPSNLALVICGLKYGEGDFGKSLCMTVNCGEDTDCTAATVGAILGIINGYDYIPKEWIEPIGTGIKTACLNIGDLGNYGGLIPQDVFSLSDRIVNIAKQVTSKKDAPLKISSEKTDLSDLSKECLYAGKNAKYILSHFNGPVYKFDFFNIYIDYKGDPYIQENKSKSIRITIENTYRIPERVNLRWHLPQGFTISPSQRASAYIIHRDNGGSVTFDFEINAGDYVENINRLILEATVEGRSTCMLVPVVLIYNT
ncbi:hypothetical protein CDQ84_06510 [Clostridium thermosuccinogenes]|jgi:ADP-ribosylglycohydrolase|uniref:ADP-ribosylglycohydrolase family protein n=1 Tax=Clostridium thermosuccinogenes TaxID=84032 RepID=A0A2K2FHC9_9CLOT|nr:ADP-ribosylglycohydrolase family protein [Pseudoclostridium thermosuccinogenes]AUS97466.1 hypothetical protein CDO33_14075 [Pseudoclostridium thermosuccinogenes]PNT93717.1 hypothetical protein CDQ83_09560 [Pseudoclostridium thermosuccinogenes]PNT98183.1 hypothetical protein CDQ85_06015 [Pseudoclostridium thermosuccinogenes]PNU00332.1 hypothetical protein CDQ84_06510 [Pseudoclostridium thermosuccinogenes]